MSYNPNAKFLSAREARIQQQRIADAAEREQQRQADIAAEQAARDARAAEEAANVAAHRARVRAKREADLEAQREQGAAHLKSGARRDFLLAHPEKSESDFERAWPRIRGLLVEGEEAARQDSEIEKQRARIDYRSII